MTKFSPKKRVAKFPLHPNVFLFRYFSFKGKGCVTLLGGPNIYPGVLSWLGLNREQVVGTPVAPVVTHPVEQNQFEPEDMPKFLKDNAIRGAMTNLFYETLGVESAQFSFGGPNFLDTHGYFMDNVFGDLSTVGSSAATPFTIAGTIPIGGTNCTASGIQSTAITTGSILQIGTGPLGAGAVPEVVIVTSTQASFVINFTNNPARFQHIASTVSVVSAPFTHRFAALNSQLGYGGAFGAQPPTHTFTDVSNIVNTYTSPTYGTLASTGIGARQYASAVLKSMDFSGNAEQLLNIKMMGESWLSVLAGTAPTNITTSARPVPNWNTTMNILGTQINNIGEFSYSFKRTTQTYWTLQGIQTPYVIARGPLDVTGSIQWDPIINEQPLDMMLLNAQGPMTVTTTNTGVVAGGVSNTQGFTIVTALNQVANIKAKIMRNKALIGYNNSFEGVANSTDAGGSGGLAPGSITLTNTVPTY